MTAVSGRVEWLSRFGIAGWARAGEGPGGGGVTLEVWPARGCWAWCAPPTTAPTWRRRARGRHRRVRAVVRPAAARPGRSAGGNARGRCPAGTPVALPPPPPLLRPAHRAPAADVGAPLALVIDEAAPDAARDAAGSAAVTSHMGALRRLGYAVAFAARETAAAMIAGSAGRVRLAYLHRLRSMLDWAGPIRAANPGVRVLYALADLESLRAARAADVLGGAPPRGLMEAEAEALAEADAVITHSAAEAAVLAARHPGLAVHVVPWAIGVAPVTISFLTRRGIRFLGNFGHAPNRDAAAMLLEAVMPRVWRTGACRA